MTTYRLCSPHASIVAAIVMVAIGVGVFSLVGVPLVQRELVEPDGRDTTFGLVFTVIFCAMFLIIGGGCLRQIYEIRANDDGTIEFARVAGTTRFDARDIRTLDGAYRRDYDGDLFWRLKITSAKGSFTFTQFLDVMEFVDRVRARNPMVQITGLWPMDSPTYPPDRGLARRDGESTR
jgi:hypothetical protein